MNKFEARRSPSKAASSVVAPMFALLLTACATQPTAPAPDSLDAALACALPSNCVNSLPGSDLPPLRFDGSAVQAMATLKAVLATFPEAQIVRAEGTALEVIFTTPAGFQDRVDFRIVTVGQRIDYRSRSSFGLFDFGKNRSRMEAFAERFEQKRRR